MIRIFLIGPLKSSFILQGVEQYKKWLSPYTKNELIELELKKNFSKLTKEEVAAYDFLRIEPFFEKDSANIVLDETGIMLSSVELSRKIVFWNNSSKKNINFFVGGPWGHDSRVYAKADMVVSLSKMTFTHEMVVLFLYEQIYRAYKIINNEKYHY